MWIGAKIVLLHNCRDVKNEVIEKKIAFSVFVFLLQKDKKLKMEKCPKAYNNSVLRW